MLSRHTMSTAYAVARTVPGTQAELGWGRWSLVELLAPHSFPGESSLKAQQLSQSIQRLTPPFHGFVTSALIVPETS